MKVILLKDLKGQGKKGDVIEVSPGYARNYLFPGGFAQEASSQNLNAVRMAREASDKRIAAEKNAALELAAKIDALTLKIPLKVSENGKIFGALTSQAIADELLKFGIEVDRKKIVLSDPIKMIGAHKVAVRPYADVLATLKIEVIAL